VTVSEGKQIPNSEAIRTTQNYWFFGRFPSSGLLENREHDVSVLR
jgi:hypothetical protein